MNKTKNEQYQMPIYRLKHDIPLVPKGTLFYYDSKDSVLGSIGAGCLKLAWTEDGNCQSALCADTIVFHAEAIKDTQWFELVRDNSVKYMKSEVTYNGETLYRKIR